MFVYIRWNVWFWEDDKLNHEYKYVYIYRNYLISLRMKLVNMKQHVVEKGKELIVS